MKPYETAETEQIFEFSIQDLQILENLNFSVLPSPEIPYKLSSMISTEYALYRLSQNKWKHSANVTNLLIVRATHALAEAKLSNVTEPKVELPHGFDHIVARTGSPKKEILKPFKDDPRIEPVPEESSGFACDYYRVGVTHPMTKEQIPYIAECGDIMESLNMTYAESNAFKAIWRTAAARTLGLEKSGNTSLRDAEKIKFFAERHYLRESVNANNTDDRIVRKKKG